MTPKLVSNKPCFYHEIFFEKSVVLSVLSVLIEQSMLRFLATGDVSTSWLAHRALTRLCQQQSVCKPHISRLELELRRTSLHGCNFPCNHLFSVQTGLKRERDNKPKTAWAGTPHWANVPNMHFLMVGGNQSTSRKPTQTWGEHANSTQKGPTPAGYRTGASCCKATVLTTKAPCCLWKYLFIRNSDTDGW